MSYFLLLLTNIKHLDYKYQSSYIEYVSHKIAAGKLYMKCLSITTCQVPDQYPYFKHISVCIICCLRRLLLQNTPLKSYLLESFIWGYWWRKITLLLCKRLFSSSQAVSRVKLWITSALYFFMNILSNTLRYLIKADDFTFNSFVKHSGYENGAIFVRGRV